MSAVNKHLTQQILKTYWYHVKQHLGFVIGLAVIVPLANLTLRFLPSVFVAEILTKMENGDFVAGDIWASFGFELLLYASLSLLGGVVLWRIAVILIWNLEMRVVQDLHNRVFEHLMSLSPAFHADRFAGSLVSQANKLANAYVRLMDTVVFQVSGLILSFVFTIIILAPKAPLVVVFLIGFSIIFVIIATKITRKIRELNAVEASKSNQQTGFLADSVSNVMAVKSFAASGIEKNRYHAATSATRNAAKNVMRASVKREIFFSSSTVALSIVALTVAAGSVVLLDANAATVFLVVTYTGIIAQGLWEFSLSTLRNVNRSLGDAKDMVEVLNIKPTILDPVNPEPSAISKGSIQFKNVTFAHEKDETAPLFDDLQINIQPGEKIGLVGHSGSGKTSLTKLLLRFNDVTSGRILIDGQDITKITQDTLRQSIAYVPQEPLLFHRSIRENIAYGKHNASDEDIIRAAEQANAAEFIATLPNGYETLVGERGIKLSGGQRQRIAIARALIKDAPILVLDEATSALDSESEKLIQQALWKLMENRTAIVIAHRLSTIQKMDRIIVLDKGEIIEEGSHTQLLKADGAYASLWSHQSGGFIEE